MSVSCWVLVSRIRVGLPSPCFPDPALVSGTLALASKFYFDLRSCSGIQICRSCLGDHAVPDKIGSQGWTGST